MASEPETRPVAALHEFGGEWTQQKLRILQHYLRAYVQVMKNQRERFRIAYIDAFAGARYRVQADADAVETLRFPDLAEDAPQQFLDGSARIALQVQPNFDRYIFIEKVQEVIRFISCVLRSAIPVQKREPRQSTSPSTFWIWTTDGPRVDD